MINLSQREKQVLNLIAFEHSSNDIAKKLFISQNTARSHRKNLLKKMDARNIAGLVRRAFELGLLDVSNLHPIVIPASHRSESSKRFRYHPEIAGSRIQKASTKINQAYA